MNDPNIKCLFHCASAITGLNINDIKNLNDYLLYYKIIGITPEIKSLEDVIKIITDFFNDKIPNLVDDKNNDDTLLKILLLTIVIYILKSNENNKKSKLMELCDKIPRELHANACAMFAPIIMRYSDGDKITEEDLEKCLKDCDKENQMMFFSPIKTNERPLFPDQRKFASQKQKIHQSIKACRNYEQFTTFVDDFYQNENEEPSSFVKLVNYVQSPDYQTSKLMKCNRDLGKNVNELEYQLFMSSTFETELDKTIVLWQDKCKTLKNKLKQANQALFAKEDEVNAKNLQIEQLSNTEIINKRLEERMKDYQDKLAEIQSLNNHLDEVIEENKKLKVENNSMNHYVSLAKNRRMELEKMSKELDYQKEVNSELSITKERLSKTETILAELQSGTHNLNGNLSLEDTSDGSFNTSFYNPEPMSYVVEKERDELIGELSRLKETTVDKVTYQCTVQDLTTQLLSAREELQVLTNSVTEAILFYQNDNKDDDWIIPESDIVNRIKELCKKNNIEKVCLSESITNVKADYEILARSNEDKEEKISALVEEIRKINEKLSSVEAECKDLIENEGGNQVFNIVDFAGIVKKKLSDYNSTINQYEEQIDSYKNRLNSVDKVMRSTCGNLQNLREELQQLKDEKKSLVDDVITDISRFEKSIADESTVESFSQSWLESLYNYYHICAANGQLYVDLKEKYEQATSDLISLKQTNELLNLTKECLETNIQQSISQYESKLIKLQEELDMKHEQNLHDLKMTMEIDFNNSKKDLMKKHDDDEREMKIDMEKLIEDYQECLDQLNKLGLEHEDTVNTKDNVISKEIKKVNDANKQIHELSKDIFKLNQTVSEYHALIIAKDKELALQKALLDENSCLCTAQETQIREHLKIIDILTQESKVLADNFDGFESIKGQYNDIKNLYDDSEKKIQQLQETINEMNQNAAKEVCKFSEELQHKELDLIIISSKLSDKKSEIEKLTSEYSHLETDLNKLKNKEVNYIAEISSKKEKLSYLEGDLMNAVKTIESLKFKVSKANLEKEKMTLHMSEKKTEDEIMQLQISTLKEKLKGLQDSLTDNVKKNEQLESCCSLKETKIVELQSCVDSYNSQINSLSSLLMTRNCETEMQQKELEHKTLRISNLEKEKDSDRIRMTEMNALIEELEENSHNKSTKLSELYKEITVYKKSIEEHEQNNSNLQSELDELVSELKSKEVDITMAKASITDYGNKINNLENTIEVEMRNYEKMSIEFKHVEEESVNYMKKYNDLVQDNRDEFNTYQQTIDQLTDRIHKIEEERDDQIHEMEKSFNSKVFELEQIVEDNVSVMQSMKEEHIESRKGQKLVRIQLEKEVDRLQKALQSRENQFHEEKSALTALINKEREEKLNYKAGYEEEIVQLKNQMRCAGEKSSMELNESKCSAAILGDKVNELQVTNYRLDIDLKEKENKYQTEINRLESRIQELEPLEDKIEHFEEVTRRLMNKVTQLEDLDNIKEIQQLRQKNKSIADYVMSLEQSEKDFKVEKSKLEQQIRTVKYESEELSRANNDLKESIDNVKDQLENAESRAQSRMVTIENLEREIRSLTADCEGQKKRYLMLRDINERHKLEVERDHQSAVTTYIARIESLTKDVASFQEQIQLLTHEKNVLVEKNYSTKRIVDEQTAKLDGLQKVVWNHTENERRQVLATYDENSRFNRMSYWNDKPQLIRQLPPVSSFDRQIVDSMGLNPSSRLRFESYIGTPYTMEDEPSMYIAKELPLPPLPPRRPSVCISETPTTESIPIRKKKKEGIRLNIANKIRKSLNMEMSTPKSRKGSDVTNLVAQTPISGSLKSEMSVSTTASGKPPIPKKTFFSALKSNRKSEQMNIIDIEELRRKERKKDTKRECDDSQLTEVTSVASNGRSSMAPTSSVYSLFTQDSQEPKNEAPATPCPRSAHTDMDNFTQSAKTPKTNFVIRNLIRRSKNLSPKRKHSSTDNL